MADANEILLNLLDLPLSLFKLNIISMQFFSVKAISSLYDLSSVISME